MGQNAATASAHAIVRLSCIPPSNSQDDGDSFILIRKNLQLLKFFGQPRWRHGKVRGSAFKPVWSFPLAGGAAHQYKMEIRDLYANSARGRLSQLPVAPVKFPAFGIGDPLRDCGNAIAGHRISPAIVLKLAETDEF